LGLRKRNRLVIGPNISIENDSSEGDLTMKALTVLVMEDDAVVGMLLAELLAGMGYDVCAVTRTQADSVAAALRYQPDLMIVDPGLGDGCGLATVEEIIRTGFVPHVYVSGDILQVRVLRPDSVAIQKPFREAELAHAMQCALGRSN
jgi:DNA-binding response OmpR family regulator